MKPNAWTWMLTIAAILVSSAALAAAPQSDSLGDYARAVRKEKKPAASKSYDNDNLPREEKLSVVGNATDAADKSAAAGNGPDAANAEQSEKPPQIKPGQTPQERQRAIDAWKTKLDAQKEKVEAAAHELDLLQREYRLRAAAFYGDAGARLRNSGEWDKEDTSYKEQMDEKQKAVNDAKQQLDDLQEEARKAGLPASASE
jgi:hypothetical protein